MCVCIFLSIYKTNFFNCLYFVLSPSLAPYSWCISPYFVFSDIILAYENERTRTYNFIIFSKHSL